jgi:outer membrane protein insertion porin family
MVSITVVTRSARDFNGNNYNANYGFGVRLDLPIGPIRIDYGIPIVSDSYNGSQGQIQFNIGYQF